MNIKKRVLSYAVILVTAGMGLFPLSAQDDSPVKEPESIVFLNTEPLGAEIFLNGIRLDTKAPVLLRNLEPGTYKVEFRKDGYKTERGTIVVEPGAPVIRSTTLENLHFISALPEENEFVFNGELLSEPGSGLVLDVGSYSFSRSGGVLYIDPIYPKQGILSAFNLSVPILAVLSGIITINDFINPQSDGLVISPSVFFSWGLTASMTLADAMLQIDRRKFLERTGPVILDEESSSMLARTYYERGERMLSLGNLNEAMEYYSGLLDGFPDSPYLPPALYKIAKIHSITGELDMAAAEMELILEKYPVAELYDKTCQNLAILYFRRGDFEKSIAYLDTMVFVDPLFSREEVALYGSDILKVWSESTKEKDME